jgi:hypothetical protein
MKTKQRKGKVMVKLSQGLRTEKMYTVRGSRYVLFT